MKITKRLLVLLLSLVTAFAAGMAVACSKEEDSSSSPSGGTEEVQAIEGKFYAERSNGDDFTEVTLELKKDKTYILKITLNGVEETTTGTYYYKDNLWRLMYKGSECALEGYSEDGATIKIDDSPSYTLIVDAVYTVTFKVDGTVYKTEEVRNRKTVKMPENPAKTDFEFAGWYTDENFKTKFANEPITSNLTLYARFRDIRADEYAVTFFDTKGGLTKLATDKTTDKKLETLYNISDSSFVGWWSSDTLNSQELTAKVEEGTVLTEDTYLYAVYAKNQPSLNADGAKWGVTNANITYKAQITKPDGETTLIASEKGLFSASVTFDKAGLYVLEVFAIEANGSSTSLGKAYYYHKRLARPSALTVSDYEFGFAAVDGATSYELKIECGDGTHTVTLKDTFAYDFSECKMCPEGIKFTVTAKGDGYTSAQSATYVLVRDLDEVGGLTYNAQTASMEWNEVEGAEYYEITLVYGGETTSFTLTENSYSVLSLSGPIEFSVRPYRKGYNQPAATTYSFNRAALPTPTGVTYNYSSSQETLKWGEVAGAKSYTIVLSGKHGSEDKTTTIEGITGTSYRFELKDLTGFSDAINIQVIAKGASNENDSYPASLTLKASSAGIEDGDISYEGGMLSWAPVRRATTYTVTFPDGTTQTVSTNSCEIPAFTKAGKNVFTVKKTGSDADKAGTYTVTAYAVMFETNGSAVATQYKAIGDLVEMPAEASRVGYNFTGWFNSSDQSTAMQYGSSFVFNAGAATVIYAGWDAKRYNLNLDVSGGDELETATVEVTYMVKSEGTFPVPTPGKSSASLFYGWYSALNGQGTRYTDQYGNMLRGYNQDAETTLYAYWPTAFEFEEKENNGETVYSVKAGRDIGLFAEEEVTVPAYYYKKSGNDTYDGYLVRYIEQSAFENCMFRVINIPQSVYEIVFLTAQVGSSFTGCSKLEEINVYEVDGIPTTDIRYFSDDGVLYFENEGIGQVTDKNNTEVAFVPRAKTGTIVIPEGVEIIPSGVFGIYESDDEKTSKDYVSTFPSHKYTEVIVPSTVTTVKDKAFNKNTYLKNITFNSTNGLTLGDRVFKGCTSLVTVELPKNVTELNASMFAGCTNLTAVNIASNGTNYKSSNGVVFTADGESLVYFPSGIAATDDNPELGTYKTPDGVKTIKSNAFSGSRLTELVISADVATIEPYAFGGVSDEKGEALSGKEGYYYGKAMARLATLTFEGSDEHTLSIGEGAFFYPGDGLSSGKLVEVTLPRNLTYLGEYAFAGRGAIKTVNIELDGTKYSNTATSKNFTYEISAFYVSETISNPWVTTVKLGKNVPVIEAISGMFGGSVLDEIIVDADNPNYQFDDGVLYDKDTDGKKTKILYYLDSRVGAYVLPDTITEIPAGTFRRKSNVVEVTLHAGVKYIGDEAFLSCRYLTKITINDTAEGDDVVELVLGEDVFNGCYALTSVNLPTRTRKLGNGVFTGCRALTEITIPEGVTELGDGMFSKDSTYSTSASYDMQLVSVTLPSTLEKFGKYVIDKDGNEVLTSLNAFDGCNSLEAIYVNEGNNYFASVDGILYSGTSTDGVFEPKQLILCPVNLTGGEGGLTVTVPGTVNRIWTGAFKNNKNVTAIAFEETSDEDYSLTIDSDAFGGCESLDTFALPEGLKTVTENTFKGCTSLVTIVIPSTVALIEDNAFYGCTSLENVVFSETADGVEPVELEIADGNYESKSTSGPPVVTQSGAFYKCTKLKEISFPDRMTKLGAYVFYGSSLEKVELPAGLKTLGENVFYQSKELTSVTFRTNEEGKTALTEIPQKAFYWTALTQIVIPEGVTKIASNAFYYCSDLTSVTLPSTLVEIDKEAFRSCKLLSTIETADDMTLESIGTYAFSSCTSLATFTVPATVKTIGTYAFSSCTSLAELTFSVNEDEKAALNDIGESAFSGTILSTFTLPETTGALKLGVNLFSSCKQLTYVYLPSTVASVTNVFNNCKSEFDVEISEDNPNLAVDDTYPIIVSVDKQTMYFAYRQLELENGVLDIAEGTTIVNENAFASQGGIVKLRLPSTLTTLKPGAFHDCTALEEVEFVLSNNQTAFDTLESAKSSSSSYGVFQNCYALKKINLPANQDFTTIGDKAFANCYALETIELPKYIEAIGSTAGTGYYSSPATLSVGAFARCTSLKSVTLPASLKRINDYSFAACTSLTEITLPANLEKIGIGAFALCSSLQTVDTSKCAKLTTLGSSSFRESGLTAFEVPKSVNSLGSSSSYGYVFYKCADLKTVTFAEGTKLKTVGNYTFSYSGVESVDLSSAASGTTTFGTYLFSHCEKLTDVKLPSAMTTLPNYMFECCTSLTGVKLDENGDPVIKDGDYDYTLELPAGLLFMGTNTFQGSGLIAIKIPAKIEGFANSKANSTGTGIKYGNYNSPSAVFKNCSYLTKVVFLGNPELIGKDTFNGCASLDTIVAKDGDGYTADGFFKNLKYVGNNVFLGTAIKEANFNLLERMGTYMFAESALEKVTFTQNVVYNSGKNNGWGNYAFYKCANLKGVMLDENGEPVIENGDYVYTIQLPGSTYYGTYTFSESGLIAIKFPTDTTAISSKATEEANSNVYTFKNCVDLKKVVFEDKVTLIGAEAFNGCTSLSEIVGADGTEKSFFENLTSIGESAFKGTAITKATLSNLTVMGNYAFKESALEEVSFGKKLTSGKYAFENCNNLATVTLSTTQDKIFNSMFSQCSALESIALPDTVKTIEDNAFASTGITGTLTLPKSLTESGLSASAFWNCSISAYDAGKNTNFSVKDGVLYDKEGTKLISVPKMYDGDLDLTAVEDIGKYAFLYCRYIKSVKFPESPEAIPEYAFYGWFMDESIAYEIPETVTTIGKYAFANSNLSGNLVIPESVTTIGNYAFQKTDIMSVVIPSALTSMGTYVFNECKNLTTVTFTVTDEKGITNIGAYAFKDSGLTSVTIPATLAYTKSEDEPNGETNIGANAFEGCADLKTVVVEEGIVTLGTNTKLFYNAGVETVTLPSTLQKIGEYTFAGTKLTSVTLPAELTTIGEYAFYGTNLTSVTLPDELTTIGTYAFADTNLTSVTLPDTVTSMGTYAFADTKLTSVTLSAGLTTIASSAFRNAPLTGTITVPEAVTSIGTYAFAGKAREAIVDDEENETGEYDYTGCSTIEKIVLPDACATIDTSAFANLYSLKEVNLENVQKLGNGAFAYAGILTADGLDLTFASLTSVSATDPSITDGVKTKAGNGPFAFANIAKATFENETAMKGKLFFETAYLGEVVLPDGITEIPSDFYAFSAITEVTILATVETIKLSAFEGCQSLTKVTFEEGSVLDTIEYLAFGNCTALEEIVLPDTLKTVGHNVFTYCISLKSLVIPYDVAENSANPMFTGWTAEQTLYFEIEKKYFFQNFNSETLTGCEANVVYGYKG